MTTVVVEDLPILRDVLKRICADDLRHDTVLEAADGMSGYATIVRAQPDLVLLDLELPAMDGFELIQKVRREGVRPRFLIFSAFLDTYTVWRIDRAAVHGFVPKTCREVAVLTQAIAAVSEGRPAFAPEFQQKRQERLGDPLAFDKVLSPRQIEVLEMLGDMLDDAEIARELGLEDGTVDKHRFNIMKQLGLSSKAELLRYARRHGFTRSIARPVR